MSTPPPSISLPVKVLTLNFTDSVCTVVECPHCYALVVEGMLDRHSSRLHSEEG